MSGFDLLALEEAWFSKIAKKTPSLSTEILGKMAACALLLYGGSNTGDFDSDDVETLFLCSPDPVPGAIREVLHVEHSLDKTALLEKTELTLGAQRVGITGRLNPENKRQHAKWSNAEAYLLLEQYKSRFPDVVDWITNSAKSWGEHERVSESAQSA